MSRVPGLGNQKGCSVLIIIGWVVALILGGVLVYLGFVRPALERRDAAQQISTPQASPTAATLVSPTPQPTAAPTATPMPATVTPLPSAALPTATPAVANMVAGADGVNVRAGPGTNFNKIGYIDPGVSVHLTGRYSDWWQIDYNGTQGWVFSELVSVTNADGVPQVHPPASPTPAPTALPTATPMPTGTSVPPTATTAPAAPGSSHGLQVNSFTVEDAPGPFDPSKYKNGCSDDDGSIWFNMDLTVVGSSEVAFTTLGGYVQETDYQKDSYTDSDFNPGETFEWHDCLHIPSTGTYHIWLRICYSGGGCENLAGPITVEIKS